MREVDILLTSQLGFSLFRCFLPICSLSGCRHKCLQLKMIGIFVACVLKGIFHNQNSWSLLKALWKLESEHLYKEAKWTAAGLSTHGERLSLGFIFSPRCSGPRLFGSAYFASYFPIAKRESCKVAESKEAGRWVVGPEWWWGHWLRHP